MATLDIRKKSEKVWEHLPSDLQAFIVSKFYAKTDGNVFKIVEDSGSNRREYLYSDITVYDDTDGGVPETFASPTALMLRLEELKYVGFNRDGDVPSFITSGAGREEFEWTSGSQIFTISENINDILSIEVSGQGALSIDQYTVTLPNQFEILDPLNSGDYIVAIYNKEAGAPPEGAYTRTQTDALLLGKVDKETGKGLSENDLTDVLKASYDAGLSNKQNSLAADGTGAKYPTVDAVNQGLSDANDYADSLVTSIFRPAGSWDASGNTFPTAGTGTAGSVRHGDTYNVTVAGTPAGFTLLDIGDNFYALIDNPGQTTANWDKFESNTDQATESLRGTAKIVTQVIIEDIATTNDTDIVTAKKFWFGITKFLTLAWTWSLKQTFTTAPRLNSVGASKYLKTDGTNDVIGVSAISNTDITGLGTLSTQNGTFSGTSSGTNSGDQTITLTGDVTGSGTGSFVTTLASIITGATKGAVDKSLTIIYDAKGRLTSVTENVIAIAQSQVTGLVTALAGKKDLPIGRAASSVSLAVNTARTPSTNYDVEVIVTFNQSTGDGDTSTASFQMDTTGNGTFVTMGVSEQYLNLTGIGVGGSLVSKKTITKTVPKGSQYRWTTSGTAATVVSIYETIL